jgi:hypothetical protein
MAGRKQYGSFGKENSVWAFAGLCLEDRGDDLGHAVSRRVGVHRHVRDPAAMAGSGDKQTLAKLCRVEVNEVAVAFGPPAGCEVITEAVHCPLLGVRPDSGPDRCQLG